MNDLATALAILSAMITPAVLITACGSLILTTSQRLSRVIDRARKVAAQFEEVAHKQSEEALLHEEQQMLFEQLGRASQRARLLQRAMASLYLTLGLFVATSIAIGIIAATQQHYTWLPLLLGIGGAILLFYASILLILESRLALASVNAEMNFVLRLSQHHAPADIAQRRSISRRLFRRAKT